MYLRKLSRCVECRRECGERKSESDKVGSGSSAGGKSPSGLKIRNHLMRKKSRGGEAALLMHVDWPGGLSAVSLLLLVNII